MDLHAHRDRRFPWSLLFVLACVGCGVGVPSAAAQDRERNPDACRVPADCTLVWTTDDVCGCCGVPRRGHVEALSGRAASERLNVGCPACACMPEPALFATCGARHRCEVVDLTVSEHTACTSESDCTVMGASCVSPVYPVAVRRGSEARVAELLGCVPAPLAVDPAAAPRCRAGHCVLPPLGEDGAPLPWSDDVE